ncbi:hypothetical protein [uncultured Parasutterella sp.]|uniref:hypothetical protein n=1 Tax=uncultured Parasutterella sp. TaxID=1263098 RepID=UPI002599EA31|nr:hypothetical protein [uncultured Parasutterella sp.]
MKTKELLFAALFSFSSIASAETDTGIGSNEVNTVGGKLTIRTFETDPSQLVLNSSNLPIAENYYLELVGKVHFSDEADFVLVRSSPGGNATPNQYYVVRVGKDKTWRLTDISCTSFKSVEGDGSKFYKDGETVKVVFPEYLGHRTFKVTAELDPNGELIHEEKKIEKDTLMSTITSFDDVAGKELPPVALILIPAVRDDLLKKGTYSFIFNYLDGLGSPLLNTSDSGDVIYLSAHGSHAESWQEIDMWTNTKGKYWILYPTSCSGEECKFLVFTNLTYLQIRTYLEALLNDHKYPWFEGKYMSKSSFTINGQNVSASEIFK